jgi:hypothetical protein
MISVSVSGICLTNNDVHWVGIITELIYCKALAFETISVIDIPIQEVLSENRSDVIPHPLIQFDLYVSLRYIINKLQWTLHWYYTEHDIVSNCNPY